MHASQEEAKMDRKDVEMVVDYALTLAKEQAAKTRWKFDDTIVSWVIAGRDGFVRMVCRMFGVPFTEEDTDTGALVFMPMRGEVTLAAAGLDELHAAEPQPTGIASNPKLLQLLQFILNILAKWVGPIVPVPTPTE